MIIEGNGIKVDASVNGNVLTFQILKQTKIATDAVRLNGIIHDGNYSLRSNKHPAYNKKMKRFFIRGTEPKENDKIVEVKFISNTNATRAFQALQKLIKKIEMPQASAENNNLQYDPGGTTAFRFSVLTKSQAEILNVTGKKHYPNKRFWKKAKPTFLNNAHWNIHNSQCLSLLNKTIDPNDKTECANPHFVNREHAIKSLEMIRELFDKAEKEGVLVGVWRLATNLRSCDLLSEEEKGRCQNDEDNDEKEDEVQDCDNDF